MAYRTATLTFVLGASLILGAGPAAFAQTITLKGASQFDDTHSFNQNMLKLEEETKKCYGKPVSFVLHRNRELGLEKDYFSYMSQGLSVDYAVVAPSHISRTLHAITIRPLVFSAKTFKKLPADLQTCLLKAAPVAGAHARKWERDKESFAREIGAEKVLQAINAVK